MADILKWALKAMAYGVVWVFILSSKSGEVRLFDKVSDMVVNNRVVIAIDTELSDVWSRLYQTASHTVKGGKKKAKETVEEF